MQLNLIYPLKYKGQYFTYFTKFVVSQLSLSSSFTRADPGHFLYLPVK